MRTRKDLTDKLPPRVYLRRGRRTWTWYFKHPDGRNTVLANAGADDPEAQTAAQAAAIRLAKTPGRVGTLRTSNLD